MEAACRGAKEAGGTTVGILPGADRAEANAYVDVAVATGLGEARNALVVRAADALIAVGGAYGTLSEIALALKAGKPVVGIGSWEIEGVEAAGAPARAVDGRPPRPHHLDSRPMAGQSEAPYLDALRAYADARPGPLPRARAQGRAGRRPGAREAIGERALAFDIPALTRGSTWARADAVRSRRRRSPPRRGARGAAGSSSTARRRATTSRC